MEQPSLTQEGIVEKPEKAKISAVIGINEGFWVGKINKKYDDMEAYFEPLLAEKEKKIDSLELDNASHNLALTILRSSVGLPEGESYVEVLEVHEKEVAELRKRIEIGKDIVCERDEEIGRLRDDFKFVYDYSVSQNPAISDKEKLRQIKWKAEQALKLEVRE